MKMYKTRRRSKSALTSGNSKKSSHSLDIALSYFFKRGEYEIRKQHPNYVAPTSTQFINEFQKILSKADGTSVTESLTVVQFLQYLTNKETILSITIGARNTLCDKILAYFAVAVYAAMAYNMSSNYFVMPRHSVIDSIADPVMYLFHIMNRYMNVPSIPNIHNRIVEFLEDRINMDSHDILSQDSLAKVIMFFLNSLAYTKFLENLIACLLAAVGIVSCETRCPPSQWMTRRAKGARGSQNSRQSQKKYT
jgi:hypothetical protein